MLLTAHRSRFLKFAALLFFLIILFQGVSAAFFDKPYYTRDEIPRFVAESGDFIQIFYQEKPFKPFPDSGIIRLRPLPDDDTALKQAYIPLGFNAPCGAYTVLIDGDPQKKYHFIVTRRLPDPLPGDLFMWTVENGGWYDRLKGDFLREKEFSKGNIERWMNRVGLNALHFMIGQTDSSDSDVDQTHPWLKGPLTTWKDFSRERPAPYKGGYIGCFLAFGNGHSKLPDYFFSFDFDPEKKTLFRNKFVSITDENRIKDILALARDLDKENSVDFVGLDYVRMGPGGFEHFKEFSKIFDIDLPSGSERAQASFIASHVRLGTVPYMREKWRYFRAYKTAGFIRTVKNTIEKPLFVFTLGWEQGHSHGQDPVMFSDAGADLIMVMFYEATHEEHDMMMTSWEEYLKRSGPLQLLAGQDVDVVLNDASDPARQGPEEMLRRYEENLRVLHPSGSLKGFFLHDLVRTFNGRILPHYSEEWLFAAGAVRQRFLEIQQKSSVESRLINRGSQFVWILQNKTEKPVLIKKTDIFPDLWKSFLLYDAIIPPQGTLEIYLPYRYSNTRLLRNYLSVQAVFEDGSFVTDILYYPVR
ncbi:MAG TPA: hypothetical protein ENN72_01070 [Firmicutes bacterium]|nr:hypothetical protein [Bacillota bacterium]